MVGIQLEAKVSEKGQIVIPKPLRKRLRLEKNTEIVFDLEGEKIILKKKQSGLEVFQEFVNAIKKRELPKHIDWDKEYYRQMQ